MFAKQACGQKIYRQSVCSIKTGRKEGLLKQEEFSQLMQWAALLMVSSNPQKNTCDHDTAHGLRGRYARPVNFYDVDLWVDVSRRHMLHRRAQDGVGKTQSDFSRTWQETVAVPSGIVALALVQRRSKSFYKDYDRYSSFKSTSIWVIWRTGMSAENAFQSF